MYKLAGWENLSTSFPGALHAEGLGKRGHILLPNIAFCQFYSPLYKIYVQAPMSFAKE